MLTENIPKLSDSPLIYSCLKQLRIRELCENNVGYFYSAFIWVFIADESMSSQETVILDEEPDEKPIVNLESIHRVVSSSQSFCGVKPRTEEGGYCITKTWAGLFKTNNLIS